MSDFVIRADDNFGIKVEVTGGPEGDRAVTVEAGKETRLPGTSGYKYKLAASTLTGTNIGDVTMPGGVKETWDCWATDDYGKPNWGCVIGVG